MKKVNRLKPQIIPFEPEHFYIHKCPNNYFQLRDSSTHVVVSTSTTIEGLRECFKRVLGRYKNYSIYSSAMAHLSEPAISPRIAKKRAEEYKNDKELFSDIVYSTIEDHVNIGTKSLRRSPLGVPSETTSQPQQEVSPRKSFLKKRTNRLTK